MTNQALRLWDTCSYVRRFTDPRIDEQIAEDIRRRRFLLCAVVTMELYAGARDAATKRGIDDFARHLDALGRVVAPTTTDYYQVGVALGR